LARHVRRKLLQFYDTAVFFLIFAAFPLGFRTVDRFRAGATKP
jgi:hypothetical protein